MDIVVGVSVISIFNLLFNLLFICICSKKGNQIYNVHIHI